MAPIDEDRRRRFERHRRDGGRDPLGAFLPEPDTESFAETLEELVLIDLEMRWKAWQADGAQGAAPGPDDYAGHWSPASWPAVRRRITEESAWLEAHYRAPAPRAGGRRGRYVLLARIGRGASAEVWRARDTELDREVALKIPRADLDAEQMLRAGREARAAAGLRHPGIVTVYGVEEHDGRPYFALELVTGRTLADALAHGPWAPDDAALLVARVADAIAYAHDVGVVHRDLKPGNILLEADGRPRIADFGLAHLASSRTELTQQGEVLGTPAWMAPEQARGATDEVDARTDVYALGALLYALLTGRKPFEAVTAEATLFKVVHEEAAPLRRHDRSLPVDLETLVAKAMAKEPSRRYASAAELAADLRRFLARRPIEARRTSLAGRLALWVHRNPGIAATLALAVLAVAVVSALGLAGVIEERRRFRAQRDRAQANLFRSLLGEADAVRTAQGANWQQRALDLLRRAAPYAETDAERLRVRNLLARCVAVHGPSIHRLGAWASRGEAVVDLAPHPSAPAVAVLRNGGALELRSVPDGALRAQAPAGAVRATHVAWLGGGRGLVLGREDGALQLLDGDSLAPVETTATKGSAVSSLAGRGETLAVGHEDGRIELLTRGPHGGLRAVRRVAAHEDGVLALRFSEDGERLLSGGRDRTTRLWRCADATPLARVTTMNAVRHVAWWSPQLACFSTFEQYSFRMWDVGQQRVLEPVDTRGTHARPVTGMLAGRGGLVVTAAADGSLSIWRTKRLGRHVRFELVHRAATPFGPITALRELATEGVVAAHADGSVSLWSLRAPTITHRFRTGQEAAFLRGSERLATTTEVWDYADGERPRSRALRRDPVAALATAAPGLVALHASGALRVGREEIARVPEATCLDGDEDDVRVVVGTRSGAVCVADTRTGALHRIGSDLGAVHDVAFDPGGAHLVLATGGLARVDGNALVVLERAERTGGTLARGGAVLAATGAEAGIEVRDARSGSLLRRLGVEAGAFQDVALSGDGERVLGLDTARGAHLWRTADGEEVWSVDGAPGQGRGVLVDGPRGIAVLVRHLVEFHDLASGRPVAVGQVVGQRAVVDARAGRYVVTGPAGGAWAIGFAPIEAARSRHGTAGAPPVPPLLRVDEEVVAGGHPETVWGVATSPDGRWIATCGYHGGTCLWDARTLEQVRTLPAYGTLAWTVAFSPDGATLAVGTNSEVRLYAVPSGEARGALVGHEHLVTSIAFHPQAPLVVTSSQDGTVRIWDRATCAARGALASTGARVSEVEFHPRGAVLGAACDDGSVALWDGDPATLVDGAPPKRRWTGHDTALWTLAFDAGGGLVATGSEDGVILVRDAASGTTVLQLPGAPRLRSLSFSDSGRYLAAACWSAPSTTWDLVALDEALEELGVGWR